MVLVIIFFCEVVLFEVLVECILGFVLGGYKFYNVSLVLYIFLVDCDLESGDGFVRLFLLRVVLDVCLRVGLIGEIWVMGIVLEMVYGLGWLYF